MIQTEFKMKESILLAVSISVTANRLTTKIANGHTWWQKLSQSWSSFQLVWQQEAPAAEECRNDR